MWLPKISFAVLVVGAFVLYVISGQTKDINRASVRNEQRLDRVERTLGRIEHEVHDVSGMVRDIHAIYARAARPDGGAP